MEHALTVMRNIGNVVHSFTEPPADKRTELDLGLKDQARPTQERHCKVLLFLTGNAYVDCQSNHVTGMAQIDWMSKH